MNNGTFAKPEVNVTNHLVPFVLSIQRLPLEDTPPPSQQPPVASVSRTGDR